MSLVLILLSEHFPSHQISISRVRFEPKSCYIGTVEHCVVTCLVRVHLIKKVDDKQPLGVKKAINLKGASGKMIFTARNKKRTAKVDLTYQLQVKPTESSLKAAPTC